MPVYINDCLQDLVLQAWQQPRLAVIRAVQERPDKGDTLHLWHASTSSSTVEAVTVSAAYAAIVYILPDSAVSDTLKVKLQTNTHPAYRA